MNKSQLDVPLGIVAVFQSIKDSLFQQWKSCQHWGIKGRLE